MARAHAAACVDSCRRVEALRERGGHDSATIPGGEQAIAYAVFALIGTVGVGAPVAIYFAMGDRAGPILERLKEWMGQNNAVIMAVLCLVIGAKLVGDAIAGLA